MTDLRRGVCLHRQIQLLKHLYRVQNQSHLKRRALVQERSIEKFRYAFSRLQKILNLLADLTNFRRGRLP